jgi:GNAT superfamily N-acetyltransferase
MGRDRDADGRARQARPRDALGRPLPYGTDGVEPVSDEPLPPAETVVEATRLFDEGRPFAAHEVFEARWKDAPEYERDLWQGMAQLCVAVTHALRGNGVGAARLLDRGRGRLARYADTGGATYTLDLDAWAARAQAAVDAATPTVR